MLKSLEYETVLVKVAMAFVAAVMVVIGLILLMGIQLTTCNPVVLVGGVSVVSILFVLCSII